MSDPAPARLEGRKITYENPKRILAQKGRRRMARIKKKISWGAICLVSLFLIAAVLLTAAPYLPFSIPDWRDLGRAVGLYSKAGDSVTFFNVGQGDCTLVQSGNFAALIDTGAAGVIDLPRKLRHMGISSLELVIITHLHDDHMGNLSVLLKQTTVKRVIMGSPISLDDANQSLYQEALDDAADRNVPVEGPRLNEPVAVGNYTIEILGPFQSFAEENNRSLAVRVWDAHSSFLLTGDMQAEAENHLLQFCPERLKADVLKVPHHGSATSSTPAFLKAVSPAYAVFNVFAGSQSLPNTEVLERYRSAGIGIYRTDQNGSITFSYDNQTNRLTGKAEDGVCSTLSTGLKAKRQF